MIGLGTTIKYVREAMGLTQRAAARALGISDVHLCNLEHDKSRPSPELLSTIQKEWNVDVYILAWCLHGDANRLPKGVRGPMQKLADAWRSDLENRGILKAS